MSTFKIISFDGGGIKGALSTRILKRLCKDNPTLLENANLFAGTSTGGLISLALASGISGEEIDNIYSNKNIKDIFSPKRLNIIHPRFKNKKLEKFIEATLSKEATLNDLQKYVFVPAFHLSGLTQDHWQGVFFNNLAQNITSRERLVDVALASSAAPTYFPSHKKYIDGGVLTNSPAIASVITVMHNLKGKYNLNDFKVLSIGTGITPKKVNSNTSNWGILQWAIRPFSKVKLPLISVLLNDDASLEDLYCSELLGDNYFRINPILLEDVEIDDYTKVPLLKLAADNYNLEEANTFIREQFLK